MPDTVFEHSVVIEAPVEKVFAFCNSREGFQRHFPHKVRWQHGPENWGRNCELTFKFRYLGMWLPYKTKITEWRPNHMFRDAMVVGPYKRFVHTHSFRAVKEGTLYTDRVEFSIGLGKWIDRTIGLRQIRSTFAKRHAQMKAILEAECRVDCMDSERKCGGES